MGADAEKSVASERPGSTGPEGRSADALAAVSHGAGVGSLHNAADAANPFLTSELAQRLAEACVRLEVAESERRHARQALEALPQAVIVTDPFEDVVLVSGAAARLFGVPEGARPAGPVCELVRDAGLVQLIMRTRGLHTRGASRRVRRAVNTASGRRVFDIHLLCVCDQDDGSPSPWGVVTILQETYAAERRHVAEITAALSHELRTPLCSILAYTEMLLDGEAQDAAERKEFLSVIAVETQRLTRLVDNMHLIARIEAGQVEMPRSRVMVAELVRHVGEMLAPQASEAGVSLSVHVPAAHASVEVQGDGDLLTQALINVTVNAIKYTPSGGAVRVSVESSASRVSVVVRDTGTGIPAEELPFVFDRYFRGDRHRRLAGGSGLGLPLVRQVIETVHGGTATVDSAPGRGTTVRLSLPRLTADASDPNRAAQPTRAAQPGPLARGKGVRRAG